jgi:hypothetical protein
VPVCGTTDPISIQGEKETYGLFVGSHADIKAQILVALSDSQDSPHNSLHSYEASAETSTRDLPVGELRRTTFPLGFDEPLLWLCVPGAIAT